MADPHVRWCERGPQQCGPYLDHCYAALRVSRTFQVGLPSLRIQGRRTLQPPGHLRMTQETPSKSQQGRSLDQLRGSVQGFGRVFKSRAARGSVASRPMSLEFRLRFVLTVVHQFPEVVSQYFKHVQLSIGSSQIRTCHFHQAALASLSRLRRRAGTAGDHQRATPHHLAQTTGALGIFPLFDYRD